MQHSITTTTIILPRLSAWVPQQVQQQVRQQVRQQAPEHRFPSLENFLSKSRASPPLATDLDGLRLKLFGLQADGEIPVAALSRLSSAAANVNDTGYYLRMDPVSLQADMSRVMLLHSGFAGFPGDYQQQVQQIVQQVMAAEGLDIQADEDYWIIRLPQHSKVNFVSLDEALGADVSECLPEGESGRYWKRLQNEIQMALHASPDNEQRRQRGAAVINSVWFWGGGNLPKAAPAKAFARVYSADPVSRGLASLHGMQVNDLRDLPVDGLLFDTSNNGSVLVDWAVAPTSRAAAAQPLTPERLEAFCMGLITRLKEQGGRVCLHSPEQSWSLSSRDLRRFWRRPKPLSLWLAALRAQP
ncbi:MAG: hypothetical protein SH820_12695 [Xanthomonadales bacterium]|nr:hypothetical protein [Xanthomonadales bacterium]